MQYNITQSELEKLYPSIKIEELEFSVRYSCTDITPIYDEDMIIVDYELEGFELLSTPEDMYQLYLNSEPSPQEPNKMEVLLNEISEALLEAELRAVENELIINETSNYVLDLDERLTNIELKK